MKLSQTRQFRKDIKRLQKRGKDLAKLKAVIDQLITGQVLAPEHSDHPLSGGWDGHRDCHIGPDWILIYKILDHELRLERTGTHADLF
jgi:mRNA interferase YafQ